MSISPAPETLDAPAARPRALALPTLQTARVQILLALLVVLAGAVYGRGMLFAQSFGDTDDAMRMVMVRDLIDGQAWFDHGLRRMPLPGVDMHWSRLVDGALAGLLMLLRPFCGTAVAEQVVRTAWPLFWLLPAALAALSIVQRLADKAAIGSCILLLLLSPVAFFQFTPGRIDHHDLQVVAVLAALAGAVWMDRRPAAGWLAGAASGLLLTIGLEALVFAGLIGAAIALRLAADRAMAPATRAYALGLGAATALGFLAQTSPLAWTSAACDALAINLLAGVLVASAGLALSAQRIARGGLAGHRGLAAIGATGLAAVALSIIADPACLRGPFADVDPRVFAIWLDRVHETFPLIRLWAETPQVALAMGLPPVLALLAGAVIVVRTPACREAAWLLALSMLATALALTFAQAVKGSAYALWLGAPVAAAAVTVLLQRWQVRVSPALVAGLTMSPLLPVTAFTAFAIPTPEVPTTVACNASADFATLAGLPRGRVLADVDLGPNILAFTPHSVMSAPYHRMAAGIIAGRAIFDAGPATAETSARENGIRYVVLCGPVAPPSPDARDSLYQQLNSGDAVDWLKPLPSDGPLHIFQIRSR